MDILDRIVKNIDKNQRPLKNHVNFLLKSERECSRKKYPNYCSKIFDDTTCKGTGKAKYVVITSIPGSQGNSSGIGTHVFCESCLDDYKKKTKEKGMKRNVFVWKKINNNLKDMYVRR